MYIYCHIFDIIDHIIVYIFDKNFSVIFELRADCLSDLQRNSKLN